MGFQLVDFIYKKIKKTELTPTQKAVLLFLAHKANDSNGMCRPKIETIASSTSLGTTAVKNALCVLRAKKYIEVDSGGWTNWKLANGVTRANDYKLHLPGFIFKPKSSHEASTTVDARRPPQRTPDDHGSGRQTTTAVDATRPPTTISDNHVNNLYNNPVPTTSSSTPTRRQASRSGSGLVSLGSVAASSAAELFKQVQSSSEQQDTRERGKAQYAECRNLIKWAMDLTETQSENDNRAFSSLFMKHYPDDIAAELYRFESEKKQGEMNNVRSHPALLTYRIKALRLNNLDE